MWKLVRMRLSFLEGLTRNCCNIIIISKNLSAYERDNQHQDDGEDDDQNNANEQQEPEHQVENQQADESVSMN